MSSNSWAPFTITCLVVACQPHVAAATEPNPVIAIRIENANGLDGVNLRRAQDLASEIYEQAGVILDWSDATAPERRTLTIVMTTIATAPRGIAPESMGVAPSPGDGTRGTIAYVFMDRVIQFVAAHRVSAEYVLACALAHEIGHLLLPPNAHVATGVMRGNWHAKLFPPHAPGVPGFPPAQARLLRLRAQSRHQTPPSIDLNAAPAHESVDAVHTVCLAVSAGIMLDARDWSVVFAEAQTIWQPHGVGIRQGQADNCDRLILVKSDVEARPRDMTHDSALAWVPFAAGRARRLIFLRATRARALIGDVSPGSRPADLTRFLVARFLGRILAHELGHVLLNSAEHQPKGLMRAHYRAQEVLSAPISTYTLGAAERALFFSETGKQVRVAHR